MGKRTQKRKSWSIAALSVETGHDRHYCRRIIRQARLKPLRMVKGNPEYDLEAFQEACAELTSDATALMQERLKAERLENERREREAAVETRELISMAEVQKIITDTFLPIRQRFLALASEACALCNPTDPQFAYKALETWSAQAMRLVDEKIPAVAA